MSRKRKKKPKRPKKGPPPVAKPQGADARTRAKIQAIWARMGEDAARCCGAQGLACGCPACGKRWA